MGFCRYRDKLRRLKLAEMQQHVVDFFIASHILNERHARELLELLPGNKLAPWRPIEQAGLVSEVNCVDVWLDYKARKEATGMTQQEMADALGVGRTIVSYRLNLAEMKQEILERFVKSDILLEYHAIQLLGLSSLDKLAPWRPTFQTRKDPPGFHGRVFSLGISLGTPIIPQPLYERQVPSKMSDCITKSPFCTTGIAVGCDIIPQFFMRANQQIPAGP